MDIDLVYQDRDCSEFGVALPTDLTQQSPHCHPLGLSAVAVVTGMRRLCSMASILSRRPVVVAYSGSSAMPPRSAIQLFRIASAAGSRGIRCLLRPLPSQWTCGRLRANATRSRRAQQRPPRGLRDPSRDRACAPISVGASFSGSMAFAGLSSSASSRRLSQYIDNGACGCQREVVVLIPL